MKNTILHITVSDTIDAKPDKVVLCARITGVCKSYTEASQVGTEKVSDAKDMIIDNGINSDIIKIDNLIISEVRTRIEDEIKDSKKRTTEYKYKTTGYRYSANIIIKLSINDTYVPKVYELLTSSDLFSDSQIEYILEDKEKYTTELLEKLVNKARKQADVIAEASGMHVIGIKSIIYGNNVSDYTPRFGTIARSSYIDYETDRASYTANVVGSDTAMDIKLSSNITIDYKLD